jgi:hypothetical protein
MCSYDQYVSVLPDEYLSNIFDRFVHFDFTTMGLVDDNNIVQTCINHITYPSSKRFDMYGISTFSNSLHWEVVLRINTYCEH